MKTILTGIRANSVLTLGNYLGALLPMVRLANKHSKEMNVNIFVPDLHSFTTPIEHDKLYDQVIKGIKYYLAAGLPIEAENVHIYRQSHVPAHSELAWVLDCFTPFGEASRMTQFKDKSQKNPDNINAGLFTYPVLMAGDILLYQTDLVPVGIDQKQHLELARDIAIRFNGQRGNTFVVPDGYIPKAGAKIMSLADPTKKMSKSDPNPRGCVYILDPPETIIKKFTSAVTDSDMEVCYREGKDGINNLMTIYSCVTGKTYEEIEEEFKGKGYGDFKLAVGTAVAEHLAPIREKYNALMADKAYLEKCYTEGAEKASRIARRTLEKVYKKVGFLPK